MRKKYFRIPAIILLFVAGCTKEQMPGPIKLVPEGEKGSSKMLVDGVISSWESSDHVNVNGMELPITLDNGNAFINDVVPSSDYCIVFPAAVYSGHTGSTVTVDMPATYMYRYKYNSSSDTYTQILDAPLAYFGTAEDGTAIMKHLTGAFNIQIIRPTGMRIQRIAVSTSQNHVMSGEMQFDMVDIDNIGSSAVNTINNNTVEMLFDFYNLEGTTNFLQGCRLPDNVSSVQIPIPVLTGNVNFTITVEGILDGIKHTFQRTQATGGHLGRGEMANVSVNMNAGQPGVTTSALFETTTVDGTTYYMISDAHDFRLMAYAVTGIRSGSAVDEDWTWAPTYYNGVDYSEANYLVMADFDMGGIVVTHARGFEGEFNGGGHTISNVVTSGDYWANGLFAALGGGHSLPRLNHSALEVQRFYK